MGQDGQMNIMARHNKHTGRIASQQPRLNQFSSSNTFNIHNERTRVESAKRNGSSIPRRVMPLIEKAMTEYQREGNELAQKAFYEFVSKMGCDESDITDKSLAGAFYISLRYVCSWYIYQKCASDSIIAKLLKTKDRTTLIYGRKKVQDMIDNPNLLSRQFHYKLLLEKIL